MMNRAVLAASVVLIGVAFTEAQAGFLNVVNGGFESPGENYALPTGWTAGTPGNFSEYTNNLNGQLLPPPGTDIGSYSAFVQGAGSGSQVISGYSLLANTTYTLDALLGGRLEDSGDGFGGATIELFDATTSAVLASYTLNRNNDGSSPVNGVFAEQSASFSTGGVGGPIGDGLGIRLIGLGTYGGVGASPQTWFDNVSVVAGSTSVPEPASLVMFGMGAAALLVYSRIQRRTTTASP